MPSDDRVTQRQLTDMVDAFRRWSRTEEGATILFGVVKGNIISEDLMIAAFVSAVREGADRAA